MEYLKVVEDHEITIAPLPGQLDILEYIADKRGILRGERLAIIQEMTGGSPPSGRRARLRTPVSAGGPIGMKVVPIEALAGYGMDGKRLIHVNQCQAAVVIPSRLYAELSADLLNLGPILGEEGTVPTDLSCIGHDRRIAAVALGRIVAHDVNLVSLKPFPKPGR
jgi:hypothetical protein